MAGEIDRKIDLIRAAEYDLFTALKETDEQLYKELLKIYSKFVGPGGVLTLDPLELAQLEDSIISAIASTDYKGAIDTYIPNFDAIQNLNKDIHKELNDIDISEVLEENDKIQNFQNMVEGQLRGTNSIQVRVTEEGVKSLVNIPNKSLNELIDPITDIIRTDIIQGVTFEAATEGILNEIQKKRLGLERWAGQIARDSLNQADGIQNDEIRKEFDMPYVRYVGTIATNTRPVCWHFLTQKRVIKYEDLQKELNEFIPGGIPSEVKMTYDPNGVERRAEKGSGMIPGTNDKNWMVRRGGYNCRHQALPSVRPPDEKVIDELAPEAQAESIQFVPAKSIKEAQQFAVDNGLVTIKVDYRKVDLDTANQVNNQLLKLKKEHGVVFDEIKGMRQKTASGAATPMMHQAVYNESGSFRKSVLKINGGTPEFLRNNIEAINRQYPQLNLLDTDTDNQILNKWIKEINRQNWWVGDTVDDVVNHEYGHLLTQVEEGVEQAKRRRKAFSGKFWGVNNISRYAGTSGDEALAEIWAKYKRDGIESLKSDQVDFFNLHSPKIKIQ